MLQLENQGGEKNLKDRERGEDRGWRGRGAVARVGLGCSRSREAEVVEVYK